MSEIPPKHQQQEQQQQSAVLKPGTSAPDFTLHSKPGESVSLSQFRGSINSCEAVSTLKYHLFAWSSLHDNDL